MIVQIVEPKQLIGRIVEERRPLSFPRDIAPVECEGAPNLAMALTICLIVVVSFGSLIACALELVLSCV
jgi:hypothetical protein